jgi:hypothetical protein
MKVLVLDDHEAIRDAVVRWVQVVAPEFQCVGFSGVAEAEHYLKRNRVYYAVCDLEMRQGCDTSLLDIFADLNVPVLVFSSHVNKVLIQEFTGAQIRHAGNAPFNPFQRSKASFGLTGPGTYPRGRGQRIEQQYIHHQQPHLPSARSERLPRSYRTPAPVPVLGPRVRSFVRLVLRRTGSYNPK